MTYAMCLPRSTSSAMSRGSNSTRKNMSPIKMLSELPEEGARPRSDKRHARQPIQLLAEPAPGAASHATLGGAGCAGASLRVERIVPLMVQVLDEHCEMDERNRLRDEDDQVR